MYPCHILQNWSSQHFFLCVLSLQSDPPSKWCMASTGKPHTKWHDKLVYYLVNQQVKWGRNEKNTHTPPPSKWYVTSTRKPHKKLHDNIYRINYISYKFGQPASKVSAKWKKQKQIFTPPLHPSDMWLTSTGKPHNKYMVCLIGLCCLGALYIIITKTVTFPSKTPFSKTVYYLIFLNLKQGILRTLAGYISKYIQKWMHL